MEKKITITQNGDDIKLDVIGFTVLESLGVLRYQEKLLFMSIVKASNVSSSIENKSEWIEWIKYDFMIMDSRPKESGRYFVHRKDGKIHWEKWNGQVWAYNGDVITHWMEIKKP